MFLDRVQLLTFVFVLYLFIRCFRRIHTAQTTQGELVTAWSLWHTALRRDITLTSHTEITTTHPVGMMSAAAEVVTQNQSTATMTLTCPTRTVCLTSTSNSGTHTVSRTLLPTHRATIPVCHTVMALIPSTRLLSATTSPHLSRDSTDGLAMENRRVQGPSVMMILHLLLQCLICTTTRILTWAHSHQLPAHQSPLPSGLPITRDQHRNKRATNLSSMTPFLWTLKPAQHYPPKQRPPRHPLWMLQSLSLPEKSSRMTLPCGHSLSWQGSRCLRTNALCRWTEPEMQGIQLGTR